MNDSPFLVKPILRDTFEFVLGPCSDGQPSGQVKGECFAPLRHVSNVFVRSISNNPLEGTESFVLFPLKVGNNCNTLERSCVNCYRQQGCTAVAYVSALLGFANELRSAGVDVDPSSGSRTVAIPTDVQAFLRKARADAVAQRKESAKRRKA